MRMVGNGGFAYVAGGKLCSTLQKHYMFVLYGAHHYFFFPNIEQRPVPSKLCRTEI